MSRIGLDLRLYGTRHGGIGRYTRQLVLRLLENGSRHQFVGIHSEDSEAPRELEAYVAAGKLELAVCGARHYSLAEQLTLPGLLNGLRLDLVHFPNFNAPVLYPGRYVVTIHDMVHHKISGAKPSRWLHYLGYRYVIARAAQRAAGILTVSEHSRREISEYLGVDPQKITVTYEGTALRAEVAPGDLQAVRGTFLLRRPYFLFVGVLERKKNLENLARGFDLMLKQSRLDVDLVVAGPADRHYPEVRSRALEACRKDRVVFTGYVSDRELQALYRGALGFVSASLHEGFGLPGVEAMRFGLPLVVSNLPVFNEIYDDGAIYFDPSSAEDIAQKLELVARDEGFRQQLAKKSFARGQRFSWEETARVTLETYERLL